MPAGVVVGMLKVTLKLPFASEVVWPLTDVLGMAIVMVMAWGGSQFAPVIVTC